MSRGKRYKKSEKNHNIGKKLFKIIIVILLLGLCITGGYYAIKNIDFSFLNVKQEQQQEEKEENVSISGKLLEDKEYNGMKIKEIELKHEKSASSFKCKIENITETDYNSEDVYVIFTKSDGSELARFKYHLDDIAKGTDKNISITTTSNLVDADNFYIEKKQDE